MGKFFISQRILYKFIQIMKKKVSSKKPNNISIPQIFKKKVGHNDKKKKKIVFYQQQENFPSNYDHTKLFVSCLFEQYFAGNLFCCALPLFMSHPPQKKYKKIA